MDTFISVPHFQNSIGQISWEGHVFEDVNAFELFISNEVANRLTDTDTTNAFKAVAIGLKLTGFGTENLNKVLNSEITEERSWSIGEAIAEVWLNQVHGIVWPWNTARDRRNPRASLPGADLIGFIKKGSTHHFVFGEVKTSSEKNTPPNVLNGSRGMIHQIENLATNHTLINSLIRYILVRCENQEHKQMFSSSLEIFLNSGRKIVSLYGVLIRDIKANELDLMNPGKSLSYSITPPTCCKLVALYLPCSIEDLPEKVRGSME
ncbi:MAG TPA: hypothetical protein PK581_06395 [Caldisericia bacterium]|nr:hypothetical protein [Caldisericia bacterium]